MSHWPPDAVRFGPVIVAFDGDVLTPRPWTLAQAEWAAELVRDGPILELGCGAGQIGLAAAALSGAPVVQVDRDPAACRWAAHNARANGLAALATQRCGTPAGVLAEDERFTVVIADPPYVPTPETTRFPDDPLAAIDGGPDGLDLVRDFVAAAGRHLVDGGAVVLQLWGQGQLDQAPAWLPSALAVKEARVYGPHRALALLVGT